MTFSIYQASVPVFERGLTVLATVLKKGEAHAEARKVDPEALLNARLALDMLPLTRQVQIACDTAKRVASRLAAIDAPAHPDTETSFAELYARIDSVLAYLKGLDTAAFEGAEARTVTMKTQKGDLQLSGADHLLGFGLPNFFFHVTTAYDILRHNGVELGKMDFLGRG